MAGEANPEVALVMNDLVLGHETGPGHPERPERFEAIRDRLNGEGLTERMTRVEMRTATDAELRRVHSDKYLHTVEEDIAMGHDVLRTGDTVVSPESEKIARSVAGGILNATDAICESGNPVKRAFCAVRPPGHHATPEKGMGFCIYSNAALAARHAQEVHGLERVFIFDWDVHHGNGTQDCFYDDGSVFFASVHQHPWYPGTGMANETGAGEGKGTTANFPLPSGSGGEEIVKKALQETLLPHVLEYKPDLIIISAGFDSRDGDPLGGFRLTDEDFAEMTRILMDFAEKHSGGRLLSVLEGGYALDGLARATEAHVRALLGE